MWVYPLGLSSCFEPGLKYVSVVKVSTTRLECWTVLKLLFFNTWKHYVVPNAITIFVTIFDKVKKRKILLLSKKLHYSRSTRINKFTSEIIKKWGFLIANLCLISNTASFTIISFRKLIVPAVSSGSFLICMFINAILCVFIYVFIKSLVPNGLPYIFLLQKNIKNIKSCKSRGLYTLQC